MREGRWRGTIRLMPLRRRRIPDEPCRQPEIDSRLPIRSRSPFFHQGFAALSWNPRFGAHSLLTTGSRALSRKRDAADDSDTEPCRCSTQGLGEAAAAMQED